MAIKIKPFQFKKLVRTGLPNSARLKALRANEDFLQKSFADMTEKEIKLLKLPYPEAVPVGWALYLQGPLTLSTANDVGKFDVGDCDEDERPIPSDWITFFVKDSASVGTGSTGNSRAIAYNQYQRKAKMSTVMGYREVTVSGNPELWMDLVKLTST